MANLVPGISGGTMLLATGVYPAFISGIAEMTTLRFRAQSVVLLGSIAVTAALAILQSWSLDVFSFFGTNFGQQVLGRGFNIVVIGLASLLIWEAAALLIDRLLQARDSEGDAVVKSARLRTLLPLARSVTLLVILTVATLAVLAELGVNIAPLLTGAGVVGLAVGFGAQTLVKDVITGAFIL
ncbi:MAG: DUF368 domain-containing protein, partial [Chloroflexi bacterium]|nr:DUF368 domain-containing protein [Chloroflexota bacterium]